MEQLEFLTDDNEKVSFYVLEETRVNGMNYLLVSEQDSLDAECYILKDVSSQESAEAAYEFVEDDDELEPVEVAPKGTHVSFAVPGKIRPSDKLFKIVKQEDVQA